LRHCCWGTLKIATCVCVNLAIFESAESLQAGASQLHSKVATPVCITLATFN
jgi:hypothetical protein